MAVKAYVLGFCFNERMTDVVLMEKNRPEWQAGFLNGIGGKIETGEHPIEAMDREFGEETGVSDTIGDWDFCIELNGVDSTVYIYRLVDNKAYFDATTKTDEEIIKIDTDNMYRMNVLKNLRWIIPMLQDKKIDIPINMQYDMRKMERMAECDHDWVPADNEVVTGGFMCTKCFMMRSH